MKKKNRFTGIALVLIMLASLIIPTPITANAAANHTQSEAVEWIKARGNEGFWKDVDNAYGCQCVDLVKYYYNYLGYNSMTGNAYEYKSNHLPANSNWTYSSTPIPGSIFVKDRGTTSYKFGHVGLVYAVSGSTMYTVETNMGSPYDGSYPQAKAKFFTHPISYACTFINPAFRDTPIIPTNPTNPPVPPTPTEDNNIPIGKFDSVSVVNGELLLEGWSLIKSSPSSQLMMHFYLGGICGSPDVFATATTIANTQRDDVDNAHHCGKFHGFSTKIKINRTGKFKIYAYAINIYPDKINPCIGEWTVDIKSTDKPVIGAKSIQNITNDSFTVCAKITDKTGIKETKFAVWSQENMSDIKWYQGVKGENDIYYTHVYRKDHSQKNNSVYTCHIYAYNEMNECCAEIKQNYQVKSKTGKNLPEGDYRLLSAVSSNRTKGLDITSASKASGANVQIYSNTTDETQIFTLKYAGDGFYKIISKNSGLPIAVQDGAYPSKTNVIQETEAANKPSQEWYFQPSGSDYTIINRSNGLALDAAGAKDENGTNVWIYNINGSNSQKWTLKALFEEPTEPKTEAPTELKTEAPTEPKTEAPTEPKTETTESKTDAPTESKTEAPTETKTEATEPKTEAAEPETEPETEPATEAKTEPVSENFSETAEASENCLTVTPDNVKVTAGGLVEVPIKITNNTGIIGLTLKVEYDSNVFKLKDVRDCGLLGESIHKAELSSPYILSWANDTAKENITANGTIAVLSFEANENADLGKYPIKLSYNYENYDCIDLNLNKVKVNPQSSYIEVYEVLFGDVNSDGKIDNRDRVWLTRYLAGWSEYKIIDEKASDLDGNGVINNRDRAILARHLSNWEAYKNLPFVG